MKLDLNVKKTKPEHVGSKFNIIISLLLFAAILVTAFLVYMKSQNIDLNPTSIMQFLSDNFSSSSTQNLETVSSVFKYDDGERSSFTTLEGDIIKCNRDSISGLDRMGNEKWQIGISMSNSIIKTEGSYLLIGDKSGRDIYMLKGKSVIWNKKLDSNIININVNQHGYVTVIEEQKGYNGVVVVYDPNGKEIFTKGKADIYILDAKVSPDNSQVLISGIDTSGVSTNSFLELTNLYGKIVADIKGEDEIISSILYMKDNGILVVSDIKAKCYDRKQKELWAESFTEDVLTSNICLNKYAVFAFRNVSSTGFFKGNTTTVKIYKANGQLYGSYEADGEVRNITINGGVIALNSESSVFFINTKGKLLGKYTDTMSIVGVHFLSKSEAAVVTGNSVKIIKIG